MKNPLLLVIRGWLCVLFAQPCLAADPWPANPLKRVVIFPAGGSTVVAARLIAEFKQFIAGELDKRARIVKISSAKVE